MCFELRIEQKEVVPFYLQKSPLVLQKKHSKKHSKHSINKLLNPVSMTVLLNTSNNQRLQLPKGV